MVIYLKIERWLLVGPSGWGGGGAKMWLSSCYCHGNKPTFNGQ